VLSAALKDTVLRKATLGFEMKLVTIAASILVAATGISALAQEQPADAAKTEKKICRTEKMTGSLTRRSRICLTEAQWRELRNRNKNGVDELQGSASGSSVTAVCDASGVGPGCR
jgi:hypothetical protein